MGTPVTELIRGPQPSPSVAGSLYAKCELSSKRSLVTRLSSSLRSGQGDSTPVVGYSELTKVSEDLARIGYAGPNAFGASRAILQAGASRCNASEMRSSKAAIDLRILWPQSQSGVPQRMTKLIG